MYFGIAFSITSYETKNNINYFHFKNVKFEFEVDGHDIGFVTCCSSYHWTVLFYMKFKVF